MPGPFDSDKTKGTFEKDISCIKQNDVWSSATFNNFVKSFYNRYCSDSNFERVFANNERQRIVLDNTSNTCSGDTDNPYSGTQHSVNIADALFHVNKAKKRVECYLVSRDTDLDAFEYDGESDGLIIDSDHGVNALALDADIEPKMRLFCGRGDVSLHVPPYALFPVVPAELPGGGTPGESRTVYSPEHDAYFCVTYVEGDVHANNSLDNDVTEHDVPRYATTCELVFIFDPSIPHDNHVISRVDGNAIREVGESTAVEDVTTKLTLTFGSSATVEDLCNYLNNLTCNGYPKYKAEIVGNYRGHQTIFEALTWNVETASSGTDLDKSFTKVIRFVPIRPCISFADRGDQRFLSALTAPDGEGEGSLVESITKYEYLPVTAQIDDPDPDQPAKAVFVHTGTYGFILGRRTKGNEISMPAMTAVRDLQLVYIPDKSNTSHYVPAEALENNLPEWYKTLPGGINRAITKDYNSEFFFIPFITVTERTIEIADFILDIDTILDLGDTIAPLLPGLYQPKLLESNVTYDAWWAQRRSEKLYNAADQIYRKYRKGLYGVYEKTEEDNFRELRDLDVKRPKPNSLVRTLQMMTGLTWQLSNIVWIDPKLGADNNSGEDMSAPALKMFSGYNAIFRYEDEYAHEEGAILTPDTTVIYVDRRRSSTQPLEIDLPVDKLMRLTPGLHHVCLRAVTDSLVTDPDFTIVASSTSSVYPQPLCIKLTDDLPPFNRESLDFYYTSAPLVLIEQYFDGVDSIEFTREEDKTALPVLTLHGGRYPGLGTTANSVDMLRLFNSADIPRSRVNGKRGRVFAAHMVIKAMYDTHVNCDFVPTCSVGDCRYMARISGPGSVTTYAPTGLVTLHEINGTELNLGLCFIDPETIPDSDGRGPLNSITSVIKVLSEVADSKLRIFINDGGTAIDLPGEVHYDRWQCFDPEILCRTTAGPAGFPDTFTFIDCGLFSTSRQGRLVNCEFTVDLSNDFYRWEPYRIPDTVYTSTAAKEFDSCHDSQFFASRMFRKSPYVFYLADMYPGGYYVNPTQQSIPYTYPVKQSEGVKLTFVLNMLHRMAVRYDIVADPDNNYYAPSLPQMQNNANLLTSKWCHVFISGIKNSFVSMPATYMPAVVKHTFVFTSRSPVPTSRFMYQPADELNAAGKAVALFEAVTDSTLQLGTLDTTYPLQDEWDYEGVNYGAEHHGDIWALTYWAEPAWGFQFFTYPHALTMDATYYKDQQINRGNTLYVTEWITRQNISGIYGLYDSKVTINYAFTTQGGYLNTEEEDFRRVDGVIAGSGLHGHVRWDLELADPGAIRRLPLSSSGEANIVNYLPALPLFYLAEVYSSEIKLVLAAKQGYTGYLPLRGSRSSVADLRERYRIGNSDSDASRITAVSADCVPDFVPDYYRDETTGELVYGFPKQRVLRLAVGYTFLTGVGPAKEAIAFTAPSSYNSITGHVTRANLVAGVMNNISGWCYRLLATSTKDFVPESYHASSEWDTADIFFPQPPFTEDIGSSTIDFRNGVSGARYVNELLHWDTKFTATETGTLRAKLGTIKTAAVTKELSFDCCAPGTVDTEPPLVLQALSLLHADYPVCGQEGWAVSNLSGDTMSNPNAVVHSASREWGKSGFDLAVPGFVGSLSRSGDTLDKVAGIPTDELAVKGYAGPLAEPSRFTLGNYSNDPSTTKFWYTQFYWTQTASQRFIQHTPMVDALNTADMSVINIATSEIRYVNEWSATMTAREASSSQEVTGVTLTSLFGDQPFIDWTIPSGGLVHAVIALGWYLDPEVNPFRTLPISVIGIQDIEAVLPGISESLAAQIQSGVADGTIQFDGTSFSFPEGWFENATYTETDGTLLETDWADSGSLTFHPITITPINFGG